MRQEVTEMVEKVLELFKKEGELRSRIAKAWKALERINMNLGGDIVLREGRLMKRDRAGGDTYFIPIKRLDEFTEEELDKLIEERFREMRCYYEDKIWKAYGITKELSQAEKELEELKKMEEALELSPQEAWEIIKRIREEKQRIWDEEVKPTLNKLKGRERSEFLETEEAPLIWLMLKRAEETGIEKAVERYLKTKGYKHGSMLVYLWRICLERSIPFTEFSRKDLTWEEVDNLASYEEKIEIDGGDPNELWEEWKKLCQVLQSEGVNKT